MPDAGPLSGARLNPILAELETWALDLMDSLEREFYASGNPVGTEPTSAAEQYETLVRLRDSGSREFWNNPQAPRDLAALEKKFGPARPMAVPPVSAMPQAPMLQLPKSAPLARSGAVNVPVQGSPLERPIAPSLGG